MKLIKAVFLTSCFLIPLLPIGTRAMSTEADSQRQIALKASTDEIDLARRIINKFAQNFGQDNNPDTRREIANKAYVRCMELDPGYSGLSLIWLSVACYDELSRNFGKDNVPHIRVVAIDGLVQKAFLLKALSRQQPQLYREAIAVLEDAERQLGEDTYDYIYEIKYSKMLIEKGAYLPRPRVIELFRKRFDEIAEQFGQDYALATREKIADTLLGECKKARELHSSGGVIECYDELDRQFGADKLPAIRGIVLDGLIHKAIKLSQGNSASWQRQYRKPFPDAALAVFEEIEHRYSRDRHPAIRSQYVKSLVEKAHVWEIDDPEMEIAAYDKVIQRFGEDKHPSIRVQVAYALIKKSQALRQTIHPKVKNSILNRLVLIRAGRSLRDIIEKSLTTCQGRDTFAFITAYLEFEQQLKKGGDPITLKQAGESLVGKCRQIDYQEANAILDEVDRRFGKDEAPEVQEKVIEALFEKKGNVRTNPGITKEENIALYTEINRRFGKENAAVRKRVAENLISRGWYDLVDQWFGRDSDPSVQAKVAAALFRKAEAYQANNDFKAALAIYNEIDLRFGKNLELTSLLDTKGLLLQEQGDFDAALAVYEDIERRFKPKYDDDAARLLVRKGDILVKQDKYEAAIAIYDEVEQRFGKDEGHARDWVIRAIQARTAAQEHLSNQ